MKYINSVLLLLFSASVNAANIECQPLGHEDGKIHDIKAEIHKYTHIQLPENVMNDTKPLVGNSELWTTDAAGPHIYIKPTSELKPGQETSLHVVGASGRAYDFTIKRVGDLKNSCYYVSDGILFNKDQRAAMKLQSTNSNTAELATLWKDKYMQEKRQNNDDVNVAIRDALRKYRYQIYTRYNWDKGGDGFIGDDLISDVYDDGRFTYIRVFNQNKGIMTVEAELAGQTEMIEAKYDTMNKMYTIAGIYPKFTLKYADTQVNISRADSKTQGEY